MSILGNKIVSPVSVIDPYTIMRVPRYKGIYDIGYICSNQHGLINPDARYKPENIDKLSDITESQRKDNNFGWDIPIFSMKKLPGKDYKRVAWKYNPPTGAFRLTDFNGYNHSAISHIRGLNIGNGEGVKPVTVPRELISDVPYWGYWAELSLNNSAEIRMDDIMTTAGAVGKMHLTLIIASNRNHYGASVEHSLMAQSDETIEHASSLGLTSISAEVNTARMVEDGILGPNIPQSICAAFLAPPMSSRYWVDGISIEKGRIFAVRYNESYAYYGDGGEGGSLPQLPITIEEAPYWPDIIGYPIKIENKYGHLYVTAIADVVGYITNPRGAIGYIFLSCVIVELSISFTFSVGVRLQGEYRPFPTQIYIPLIGDKLIASTSKPPGLYTLRSFFSVSGDIFIEKQEYSIRSVTITD